MTAANLEMIEVYTKDIKAWFADEELGWVSASVLTKEKDDKSVKIIFQDDNDSEKVRKPSRMTQGKELFTKLFLHDSNMSLKQTWPILKAIKSVYHHFVIHPKWRTRMT